MMDESSELYKKNYLFRLITHFLRKPRSVTNSFAPPNVPFDPAKYDLFEAHDPLAVAHAIFYTDAELWGDTERPFLVETDGRHTRGFCVVDRRQQGEESTMVATKLKLKQSADPKMSMVYQARRPRLPSARLTTSL